MMFFKISFKKEGLAEWSADRLNKESAGNRSFGDIPIDEIGLHYLYSCKSDP